MEIDRGEIISILWYVVMMIVCFLLMVYFGGGIGKYAVCFSEYAAEYGLLRYISFIYFKLLMFALAVYDFVLTTCGLILQIFESEIAEKIRSVLNRINIERITWIAVCPYILAFIVILIRRLVCG